MSSTAFLYIEREREREKDRDTHKQLEIKSSRRTPFNSGCGTRPPSPLTIHIAVTVTEWREGKLVPPLIRFCAHLGLKEK